MNIKKSFRKFENSNDVIWTLSVGDNSSMVGLEDFLVNRGARLTFDNPMDLKLHDDYSRTYQLAGFDIFIDAHLGEDQYSVSCKDEPSIDRIWAHLNAVQST